MGKNDNMSLENIQGNLAASPELSHKQPTISIIAAGGCGINLLKKLHTPEIAKMCKSITAIDTSESNSHALPDGVKCITIGGLGSGGDRSKNKDLIEATLNKKFSELTADSADINILLFSLSGGSGSVIAPLLASTILHESDTAAVVPVGVLDINSKQATMNTQKTYNFFTKLGEKYFVPCMFYTNWSGRPIVDKAVATRVTQLVTLMHTPIDELDYSDKMLFLRDNTENMFTCLGIGAGGDKHFAAEVCKKLDDGDVMHTGLVVNDTGITPDVLTKTMYVGIDSKLNFLAFTGIPLPADWLKRIRQQEQRYNQSSIEKTDSDLIRTNNADKIEIDV